MQENQLLRDPCTAPSSEIIAEGLGDAAGVYERFVEGLSSHGIEVEWRYYNDGKAWLGKALYKWTTVRGTKKVMTVFWLSVWEGFFRVSLFIPEKARAGALGLSLGDRVTEMINKSGQIGKLKFFPLIFDMRSDEMFEDIVTLVGFKKTLG